MFKSRFEVSYADLEDVAIEIDKQDPKNNHWNTYRDTQEYYRYFQLAVV